VGLASAPVVCLLTTAAAIMGYLAVAVLQRAGWLSLPTAVPTDGWPVAAFNLLIVGLVGGLTAVVADSRRRREDVRQALTETLEEAYDEALRVNSEIRRGAQLTALGEVAAGVTHELSNVLTVAFGHVGLARRKVDTQAREVHEHLTHVEHSFDAALRIIKATLQTARAAGRGASVNMGEEAARIVRLKGYELQRDNISARLEFSEPLPAAAAAPFQMLHVLMVLVNDAKRSLRETPGPRMLEIVGTASSDHVVVEVRRTGSAIAAEELTRMFEPFSTAADECTGLGLAVAAGIVRALGGELVAENPPKGGALFRVTLPVHGRQSQGASDGTGSR
jgi:C4-dicarboxylate-specific signal transduction histidine kinase